MESRANRHTFEDSRRDSNGPTPEESLGRLHPGEQDVHTPEAGADRISGVSGTRIRAVARQSQPPDLQQSGELPLLPGLLPDTDVAYQAATAALQRIARAHGEGVSQALEHPVHILTSATGDYWLTVELTASSTGAVHLALNRSASGSERVVAIKWVAPQLVAEPGFAESFIRELRHASQIEHPGLCRILDFAGAEGVGFVAMEFLEGESIRQIWRAIAAPFPTATAVRDHLWIVIQLAIEFAQSLEAIHSACDADGSNLGLVHGHICPDTLFVTYSGDTRILNLGMARTLQFLQMKRASTSGDIAYLAPEQLRGEKIDKRADIWALGVVLWELVTDKRLFKRGSEQDTLNAVLTDRVPLPSQKKPGLARELDRILSRALARDAADRYPSAKEFAQNLQQFLLAEQAATIIPVEIGTWLDAMLPWGRERAASLKQLTRALASQSSRPPPPHVDAHAAANPSPHLLHPALGLQPLPRQAAPAANLEQNATFLRQSAQNDAERISSAPLDHSSNTSHDTGAQRRRARDVLSDERSDRAPNRPGPERRILALMSSYQPKISYKKRDLRGLWLGIGLCAVGLIYGIGAYFFEPSLTPAVLQPAQSTRHAAAPRAPARSIPASPSGTGSLRLNTSGGSAEVFLNGQFLGLTPLAAELVGGRKSLTLKPTNGANSRSVEIDIKPGNTAFLTIPLAEPQQSPLAEPQPAPPAEQ